ncbi:autotransporter outer membrane beta-barrel domain-containing protein, partial [Escherichia coli]|nr:autotransporter outer membrane beta-barrel domain-containing protein [Escherichia coli]
MNKIYSLKYSSLTGGLIAVSELSKKVKGKTGRKLMTASVALSVSLSALPGEASTVSAEIPYQTFRDFAENKGVFTPGATGIEIKDKNGNLTGVLNTPMIDFSSLSRDGHTTLVHPGYGVSAKHGGLQSLKTATFGYNTEYKIVNNNHAPYDFTAPRYNKLVTEVVPAILGDGGYNNSKKYTTFYRAGVGEQYIKEKNGTHTLLTKYDPTTAYLTGGTVGQPYYGKANNQTVLISTPGNTFDKSQGPLASYGQPGDSGSPLYAWDKTQNRWVLAGVTLYNSGVNGHHNWWLDLPNSFINKTIKDDSKEIVVKNKKEDITWSFDKTLGTGVINLEKKDHIINGHKNNNPDYGDNIVFSGEEGVINITNDIAQGAGFIQFDNNYIVSTKNNSTWTGSGIIVNDGSEIYWGINGVKDDNLHKLGNGKLIINGNGINTGGLKVGDGTVLLSQHKDAEGRVQAFSSVNISSGRPVVVLSDDKQINPDNISWGYRGGTLDLNGNNITFTRIQASDYGAIIANNNDKKSIANLNISTLKDTDINVSVSDVHVLGGKGKPGDLFYDRGTGRYLILKKERYEPFFQDVNNTSVWQNVGKNRNEAIAVVKNEKIKNSSKPYIFHGQLNGNMDINIQSGMGVNTFAIDGSVNIPNGTLSNKLGSLIFQGHPVIHAGVGVSAEQNDWETRYFTLNTLNLDGSDFHLSRNAVMTGNIHATNSSKVTLGSSSVYVDRNDGTGESVNSTSGTASDINEKDLSKFTGDITADNSNIIINNKFEGGVSAVNKSAIDIHSQHAVINRWSDISDNSKLTLKKNATLTVNTGLVNKGTIEIGENAELNIQGYPIADKFIPSIHDLGNVKMTASNATLTAGNYAMFSGEITADDATAVRVNLGSETSTLSEFNPNPELTDLMFDKYNTSWAGKISALKGDASMVNTVWRMTGDSGLNTLKTSKSLTVFSSDNKFSTLTVNDLTTSDSTFVLRSDSTGSDKVVVKNKLEGKNNNLLVDYVANDGKHNSLNLELVSAPTGTAADVFNSQTQNVGFSDVTPVIEQKDSGEKTTWTLKGFNAVANQQSAEKAENFMSADYKNFLAEVNNLNKRMGDLRDINGEAGAWARIMSGTGSASGGFSDNYTHVQVGVDKKHELDGLDLFTGFTVTHTDSSASADVFSGKTKSVGAGLYASAMFDSGAYIDLIGKYVHHDNEYTATFAGLGTRDYSTHSWYAGAEAGYRYHVTEDAWIEPQAELVYGSVSGKQFAWKDQGMHLSMKDKDYNPLIGRTGVDVGKSFSGKDWKVTARAGLGYQFDLLANGETVL